MEECWKYYNYGPSPDTWSTLHHEDSIMMSQTWSLTPNQSFIWSNITLQKTMINIPPRNWKTISDVCENWKTLGFNSTTIEHWMTDSIFNATDVFCVWEFQKYWFLCGKCLKNVLKIFHVTTIGLCDDNMATWQSWLLPCRYIKHYDCELIIWWVDVI